ncbi:MAG: hypothetical protein KDI79_23070 [Anaerolineae bacterium]|nr:hypothetical protein [Anaerolineae bacterium]
MMDQNVTVVAKYNDHRQISWTASGLVYLLWDRVSLMISPVKFNHMVNLLEEGVFEIELCRIKCGPCRLMQEEPGCFHLWVENVGFDLNLLEFLDLVRLVREAARQLQERRYVGWAGAISLANFEKESLCVTTL